MFEQNRPGGGPPERCTNGIKKTADTNWSQVAMDRLEWKRVKEAYNVVKNSIISTNKPITKEHLFIIRIWLDSFLFLVILILSIKHALFFQLIGEYDSHINNH